jgi:thiol-disulfide isomerase/thioredoxin
MKSKLLLSALCCIIFSHLLHAQAIEFENTKWATVLDKAKQEGKLVYLDVYTDWCGPCKMMAKTYFPDPEVGAFYNKNFVNASIDAEKGEGIGLAKMYNITGYPTNLFIDPNTKKIVYKTMGAPDNKVGFIGNGKTALDEKADDMNLATYVTKFKSGKYDEEFLKKYLDKTKRLELNNDLLVDAFINKYGKNYKDEKLFEVIQPHVRGINNKGFDLVINAPFLRTIYSSKTPKEDFGEQMMNQAVSQYISTKDEKNYRLASAKYILNCPGQSENKLRYDRDFYNETKHKTKALASSIALANFISNKTQATFDAEDAAAYDKVVYTIKDLMASKKVPKEKQAAIIEKNLEKIGGGKKLKSEKAASNLNEIAWSVFQNNRSNKTLLNQALAWATKAVSLSNKESSTYYAHLDTYANLLYATNQKEKAIQIEQDVINGLEKIGSEDIDSFKETLLKMQKGKL